MKGQVASACFWADSLGAQEHEAQGRKAKQQQASCVQYADESWWGNNGFTSRLAGNTNLSKLAFEGGACSQCFSRTTTASGMHNVRGGRRQCGNAIAEFQEHAQHTTTDYPKSVRQRWLCSKPVACKGLCCQCVAACAVEPLACPLYASDAADELTRLAFSWLGINYNKKKQTQI